MAAVRVTAASVALDDGTEIAKIEAIVVGGGTQVVTVDGVPEVRQHPRFHRFSVRLLSPDRMIPDELRDVETYDEAVDIAERYADIRVAHAERIAELTAGLKV